MKLIRYEYPTQELDFLLNRSLQQLFRLGTPFGNFSQATESPVPALDLTEDAEHFYVRLELPGVKKSALAVELESEQLRISASREVVEDGNTKTYSTARTVTLPGDVAADKITANLQDGVLTVTLPKTERQKPKQISVN